MYRKVTFLGRIRSFFREKRGAVTVDWVVLTAAIVGLGFALITSVPNGGTALPDQFSDELIETEVLD